jgi:hypothetical protein
VKHQGTQQKGTSLPTFKKALETKTTNISRFFLLLNIVCMRKHCDGVKNYLEIFTDLYVLNTPEHGKRFLVCHLSVGLYVWMCASLATDQMEGFIL